MGVDPEQGKASPLRPGSGGQASSRGDWLINCSRFLNGLTAVCALLCIAAHLMAISVAAHYPKVFALSSFEDPCLLFWFFFLKMHLWML